MKASAKKKTTVTVNISTRELVEFVRASGIHVPAGAPATVEMWEADTFDGGTLGATVVWEQTEVEHSATGEQG